MMFLGAFLIFVGGGFLLGAWDAKRQGLPPAPYSEEIGLGITALGVFLAAIDVFT